VVSPPLRLPQPATLTDEELHGTRGKRSIALRARIVLEFTDHLDDRPSTALSFATFCRAWKRRNRRAARFLHWDCADATGNGASG